MVSQPVCQIRLFANPSLRKWRIQEVFLKGIVPDLLMGNTDNHITPLLLSTCSWNWVHGTKEARWLALLLRCQRWLWPRPELQPGLAVAIGGSLAPRVPAAPVVLIRLQFQTLGVQILKLYYLPTQKKNAFSPSFLNLTHWKNNIFGS